MGLLKLLPPHCSSICFKKVSFLLSKENITKNSIGKIVYFNTDYIILLNDTHCAIVKIQKNKIGENRQQTQIFNKKNIKSLFDTNILERIKKIEIISLPKDTAFISNPTIDVNNANSMARIAETVEQETVVVHGKYDHLSFIKNEKSIPLIVYDFAPPYPPKLLELVERALDSGRIQKPIKIIPNIIDFNKLATASSKQFVMLTCNTSGIKDSKNLLFLVDKPDISSIGAENIALIGCDPSVKIFQALYKKKPILVDICPLHIKKKKGIKGIARCCKIGKGHNRIGDRVYVDFDSTLYEVEEAMLDLFDIKSVKITSYKILPALEFLISLVLKVLRHVIPVSKAPYQNYR